MVKTNLYTVGLNVSGAACLIIFAFASDLTKIRFIYIMVALLISIISFAVFGAIDIKNNVGAAYFTSFLMTAGVRLRLYSLPPGTTTLPEKLDELFCQQSVFVPPANAAGLISANIFLAKDAPKVYPGSRNHYWVWGTGYQSRRHHLVLHVGGQPATKRAAGSPEDIQRVSTSIMSDGPKKSFVPMNVLVQCVLELLNF